MLPTIYFSQKKLEKLLKLNDEENYQIYQSVRLGEPMLRVFFL